MPVTTENNNENVMLNQTQTIVHKSIDFDYANADKQKTSYCIFRRTQDVFFSLLAIVVLFPVFLILGIAIFIDSPGASPIYAQKRVGKNGKIFNFYKFRSMVPNAEAMLDELLDQNEMDGPVFKIGNDPRITRIGKIIRKNSLDELPQLFNVLKGDMSICGPRPALPREFEKYSDHQMFRLSIKPGLTCYWQVQPSRNSISFDDWVELDLKYIRERSFWLDWNLIFKTVCVMFSGEGE